MTLKPHYAAPCWELVRPDTKRPPQYDWGDGWPHYETEAAALADLDDRREDWGGELIVQRSFDGPCLGMFCDGPNCRALNEPADLSDEGWTHLDPAEPLPMPVSDMDWTLEERAGQPDLHYCPDCAPPWCDGCDEQHHGACPLDEARLQPIPHIPGQLTIDDLIAKGASA